MNANYAWLILVALATVVGLYMVDFNPEQAGRVAQSSRDAAFSGEGRDFALIALALGLGGFIAYLAISRR